MGSSVAPRDPILPRPPVRDDDLLDWTWQLTRELDQFFKAFSIVGGFATPRSGAPFIARVSTVGVAPGSSIGIDSLVLELTSTVLVDVGAPSHLWVGVDGQLVIITNVGTFSITFDSGSLVVTLGVGASVLLRWSNTFGRWTEVVT